MSDSLYENKDKIGLILFIISILLLFFLIFHPMNQHIIHGDERYSLNLVTLSLNNSLDTIVQDVHPPLYYFILMGINHLFGNQDLLGNLFISKISSIIPYVLILIISATKIRRDYGWLTSGFFALALATMSGFFASYCTLRMYSWSLLFSILAYIYYRSVLEKSNLKNWVLLTVFCVLGAYTHYFTIFPSVLMFFFILLNSYSRYKDNIRKLKKEIEKIVLMAIFGVILYLPWLFVLIQQIGVSQKKYSWSIGYIPTFGDIINYFAFFFVNDESFTTDAIILKIIALGLLCVLLYLFIRQSKKEGYVNSLKSFDGIILYTLTIIIGTIVLNLTFQPLIERYVIPVMAIFWLSYAILINNTRNRKLFTILLIVGLLLSCVGFVKIEDTASATVANSIHREELFSELNNNDTVIIYPSNYRYVCYHNSFRNAIQYSRAKNRWAYEDDYIIEKNISKILEDNPDKKVYLLDENYKNPKKKIKLPKDVKYTAKKGYQEFILLEFKE